MNGTTAMPQLRLVQIGMGGWGRDWMRVLRSQTGIEVTAIVDANPQALEFARDEGAPRERCFTSLDDALSHVGADAALITASAPAHAPLAHAALQAGLPVLIEKPFATTIDEAASVIRAAHAARLPLMISQNYRFYPAPRRAAQLVRDNELGPVAFVEVDFRQDRARATPPSPHHLIAHPMLLDMAIHHFDLMRFVLDRDPVRVDCHAFNPPWSPFRDPASAVATIEFEGGVIVSYRGSWASSGPPTPWAGEWRMDCQDGEVRWTSRGEGLSAESVHVRPLGERPRRLTLPKVTHVDRAGALDAFITAVRTGTEPESSGRENLASLALAFAAIHSAQEGRSVTLSEFLPARPAPDKETA